MSKFAEVVKQDTPRLVVKYRSKDGRDEYEWGIVGGIPIIDLIGAVARAQVWLGKTAKWERLERECPESALVITYSPDGFPAFDWFVHPDIPIDGLVGMLEMVKATLVATHMARQAAAQQVLYGPDGRPMRG